MKEESPRLKARGVLEDAHLHSIAQTAHFFVVAEEDRASTSSLAINSVAAGTLFHRTTNPTVAYSDSSTIPRVEFRAILTYTITKIGSHWKDGEPACPVL